MTPDPIDRSVRDALHDAIETHAHSGDFDATWQAAQERSRRGLPLAGLAVAAAAVLALSVPLWRAGADLDPAGFGRRTPIEPTPWEEPERLRFEVEAPAADAAVPVRAAHAESDSGTRARHWGAAFEATPAADHPELASRQALVEQARGELDNAKHAGLDGSSPGRLVAAEVHLIDLERDKALPILSALRADPRVGDVATAYLALLSRGGPAADLAEVVALSHTGGAQGPACEASVDLLRLVSDEVRDEVLALGPALGHCAAAEPAELPEPAIVELQTSGRGRVLLCLDTATSFDGPTRFEVPGWRLPADCLIQIDGAKAIVEVEGSGKVTCDKQGHAVVCNPTTLPEP